jgi:serine/threonine protein kinase
MYVYPFVSSILSVTNLIVILVILIVCHSIKLVHTDLKPENILLVSSNYMVDWPNEEPDYRVPESSEIRLIDFGGATFEGEHHSKIVNTRQYRGPEVLLGMFDLSTSSYHCFVLY